MKDQLETQLQFFSSGKTLALKYRLKKLADLKTWIMEHETDIEQALALDLGKSPSEAFLGEIQVVRDEIKFAQKNLKSWMAPKKVKTPLTLAPAKSKIFYEPKGQVLIISPWNYPFQLALVPLIGALAAGNVAVIKPSELSPHTSALIFRMCNEVFETQEVFVAQGGVETSQHLLAMKFDHIFFTGSSDVGRVVMKTASDHLTPVTLELGGKSPLIIDPTADLKLAAHRTAWGKFYNAGQTCVAPDEAFIHESIYDEFLSLLKTEIVTMWGQGNDKSATPDLSHIISQKHWKRLTAMIPQAQILFGGTFNETDLWISPTVLANPEPTSPLRTEEIFGPLLPIYTYNDFDQLILELKQKNKPLAAYLFSRSDDNIQHFINTYSFGGGVINDFLIHLANPLLPFGGVGQSGMGAYHGYHSFCTFSHAKSILYRSSWFDIKLRYPPYNTKNLNFLKKIFSFF